MCSPTAVLSRAKDNLLIGTYARHPHGARSKLERVYGLFPELADLRQQRADGMAILLVEQRVEKALRRASYCYLTETASVGAAGRLEEIQGSDVLPLVYLGHA